MIAISGRRRDGKRYRKDSPMTMYSNVGISPTGLVYNTAMPEENRTTAYYTLVDEDGMQNFFSLDGSKYAYAVVFLSTKPDALATMLDYRYSTNEQQVQEMMKSLGMTPTVGMKNIHNRLDSTSNTDIIALELKGHNQVNNAGLWYMQHQDLNIGLRRPPLTGVGNNRYTSVTISKLRLSSFKKLNENSWQENSPMMQIVESEVWTDTVNRGQTPYAVIGNVTAPGRIPVDLYVVGIVIYKSDVANKSWDD